MGKRVYVVTVELTMDLVVVADDEEQAEEVALANYQEEINNGLPPTPMTSHPRQLTTPEKFAGVLPWGPSRDDPKRDWPVEKWLADG